MSSINFIDFIGFIMSVLFYATLYAVLGYVYAQGLRAGRQSATAPETEMREPESGEVECCGGAHPPPPPRPSAHFSPSVAVRAGQVRRR